MLRKKVAFGGEVRKNRKRNESLSLWYRGWFLSVLLSFSCVSCCFNEGGEVVEEEGEEGEEEGEEDELEEEGEDATSIA